VQSATPAASCDQRSSNARLGDPATRELSVLQTEGQLGPDLSPRRDVALNQLSACALELAGPTGDRKRDVNGPVHDHALDRDLSLGQGRCRRALRLYVFQIGRGHKRAHDAVATHRRAVSVSEDTWPQATGSADMRAVVSVEADNPDSVRWYAHEVYGCGKVNRRCRTWSASSSLSAIDPGAMTDATAADEDEDEVVVRATVSRLVITTKAPVEIVESVVRDELERRRATARIQTFVPVLTERAARRRLRDHRQS
jgi:hypothetical protein